MVKITVEGTGTTLREAKDDLASRLRDTAEDQGLRAPAQIAGAQRYLVGVRQPHQSYQFGEANADLDTALSSALETAGIGKYDPKAHHLQIQASYDLKKSGKAPKGKPAGAAPSGYHTGTDIGNIL